MFNANNGRQVIQDKIDGLTDRFAAEFEDRMSDLSLSEQEALVEKLVQVMSATDTARGFATNSAGQPAQALGAGSGTQPNPQQSPQPQVTPQPGQSLEDAALHVIMTSTQVPQGVKAGILRMITPSDPNHLPVATDGTPTELVTARKALTDERDTTKDGSLAKRHAEAERKLADEQDENKSGSLAHKLAAAQRNALVPADMVRKSDGLTKLEEVERKVNALHTSVLTKDIDGIDEAKAAVAEAKATFS